ncbi:MAG: HpcH/HpaI aldolase/citrate lyase family protein [Planctomyces sp.]|nr:HpcH/HpaI aldolase/citrate lyase family protein [Planctomyces sp.]
MLDQQVGTSPLSLGASLYVPATRSDLSEIASQQKIPGLRSVIFCLEDAVRSDDLPRAIANIRRMCSTLTPGRMHRFVRVRNPEVLRSLCNVDGIDRLTGFVLPKLTREVLGDYLNALPSASDHLLMPTLETAEVFDADHMKRLRDELLLKCEGRILSLRIGGNDLLQCLGLRRGSGRTIYETPLGPVITQLITTFHPYGLNLTAPVFDRMDCNATLKREVQTDVEFGLIGKTAIHPSQIRVIEDQYLVDQHELESAEEILRVDAPAVFRHANTMCEPATHRAWAERIRLRSEIYGIAHRQ